MLTTVHHDITQEDMRPSLCESLLAESRRGEMELEEISTVENVTEENVNAGEGVKVSNTKRRRGLEGAEETQMEINPHIQKARQLAGSALSPQDRRGSSFQPYLVPTCWYLGPTWSNSRPI